MHTHLLTSKKKVTFYKGDSPPAIKEDQLTKEEPLAISLFYYDSLKNLQEHPLSITMRSPGNDEELTMGFLLTEGIIESVNQVEKIVYHDTQVNPLLKDQTIQVFLDKSFHFNPEEFSRNFYSSSSCGVCGKNSIQQLEKHIKTILPESRPVFNRKMIYDINKIMKEKQSAFHLTGGIHGTAVFDEQLSLNCIMEDVGRHNAMDKVIGALMKRGELPAKNNLVAVSGRAGFELVQKALIAGFGILTAVGAPSDLAVELAETYGMTLIGFLKNDQFNVYSHPQRISN